MSLPVVSELVRLKNNNPGTAPDYTEHDVITLRRYNGEPLNHTQADDNLELLRRALIGVDQNIHYVNNELTNISSVVNGDLINELWDNRHFTNRFDQYVNQQLGDIINNIIVHENFENHLTQYIGDYVNNNFANLFETYLAEYGDTFWSSVNFDNILNEYFTNPTSIFNDYLTIQMQNVVQEIDIEALLKRLHNYIDQQLTLHLQPVWVEINVLKATLDTILNILENLEIGGDINLAELIAIIQAMGDLISTNATNIANNNTQIQLNTEAIIEIGDVVNNLVDAVNTIGDALQDLSKAVQDGFKAMEDWVNGIFQDIAKALAQIADQVVNNSEQIVALWEAFGDLANDLWNQIGMLWQELGNAFAQLKDMEELICELGVKIDALQDWAGAFLDQDLTICVDGMAESIRVPVFPGAMGAFDPLAQDAQLAACGGPVFDKMVKEGNARRENAGKAARDARRREKARKREMKQFARAGNARDALNKAFAKGFTIPEIGDFINARVEKRGGL